MLEMTLKFVHDVSTLIIRGGYPDDLRKPRDLLSIGSIATFSRG